MSDERVWIVLTDAAAATAEAACWDAYYARRLAGLGRLPGDSIDSYADGSPAPAITVAYVRAERGGGQAALPVDQHVRDVLRFAPAAERTTDALPTALADRLKADTFGTAVVAAGEASAAALSGRDR